MYHAKAYIHNNDLYVRISITIKTIELLKLLNNIIDCKLITNVKYPFSLLYRLPNNQDNINFLINYSIKNEQILYLTNSMLPKTPPPRSLNRVLTSPPPIKRTKRIKLLPNNDNFIL